MNTTITKLNEKQDIFVNSILNLLKNNTSGLYILNAPAGTGKTACLKYIQQQTNNKFRCLAPTHKAASLLPNGKTIHSVLGHLMYHSDGNRLWFSIRKCGICEKRFDDNVELSVRITHFENCKLSLDYENAKNWMFMDECSMIDAPMLNELVDLSKTSLIILMGDSYQLPPIGSYVSPVFTMTNVINDKFELTENMRQNNTKLAKIVGNFREAVDTKHTYQVQYTPLEELLGLYKGDDSVVLLNFTNAETNRLNTLIRMSLFETPNGILESYYPGEKLMFSGYKSLTNENIYYDIWMKGRRTKHPSPPKMTPGVLGDYLKKTVCPFLNAECGGLSYYTNDSFIVDSVELITKSIDHFKCPHQVEKFSKCIECKVPARRKHTIEITFYKITNQQGVVFYKVHESCIGRFKTILDTIKCYILSHDSKGRKALWSGFYLIKETLNSNLNYYYSLTTHKSQGSQWSNVIVNITNMRRAGSFNNERLIYTAVSRATDNVYFI